MIGTVISATTPPNIPAVALAAEPLYAKGARAKPTLTLALSVEFPTVGAQYVKNAGDTEDDTYCARPPSTSATSTPTAATPTTTTATPDLRRFDRSAAAATGRKCGGTGFSGNFMNWATSSAIDILRYGLTGGDRWQDTADLTVLQRAVLPNTNVSTNFWNGSNFPAKKLVRRRSRPKPCRTTCAAPTPATSIVANCLNRMHFGTAKAGNCTSPGDNSNLGVFSGHHGGRSEVFGQRRLARRLQRVRVPTRAGSATSPERAPGGLRRQQLLVLP